MKVHIKALCILLSGLIVINMMSFGNVVFAAAVAPYVPGVGIPLGQLTPNDKNLWDQFSENFCKAFFGLNNGKSDYENYLELNEAVTAASEECIEAVPQEDGTIDFNYIEPDPDDGAAVTGGLPYVIPKEIAESDFHIDSEGNASINSSDYQQAINNVLQKCCLDPIQIGLDILNGKLQNSVTIKQDLVISTFDFLDLEYKTFSTFDDFLIELPVTSERYPTLYYMPFAITSDNELYIFKGSLYTDSSWGSYSGITNKLIFTPYSSVSYTSSIMVNDGNGYSSFRFFSDNNKLYASILQSFAKSNHVYFNQYIYSKPKFLSYPILFEDRTASLASVSDFIKEVNLNNYELKAPLSFVKAGTSDFYTILADDLLTKDITTCGYFYGSQSVLNWQSDTLSSAGKMLSGSDNPVSGGTSTTYSELSELQKAIYILAQQQGTTYDEMLSKMDMIIDSSGTMSIVGLDGLEYSVSDLSNKFDEIVGVTSEINQELSKTLEYLKSLNLDELSGYIQSLEGTLGDLNERDKDKSAVLGDCLGSLNELKEALNNLDISNISSQISSIDVTLSKVESRQQAEDDFHEYLINASNSGNETGFKLFDQCQLLLSNLFNYNNRNSPPNFQFYYDSNGDGESEIYNFLDLSFLENTLTNENMVDKSWWSTPIKIIDLIRYVIAAVCYGLFVMRLIKRLPTFYGNGPLSLLG